MMVPFDVKYQHLQTSFCASEILTFQIVDLDNSGQGHGFYNIRILLPLDGKYMTSFLMTKVMFALSINIYEIFANKVNCQKCYLENDGQGQDVNKTGLAQFDCKCSNLY